MHHIFVSSSSVESTIQILNSKKLRIWGSRNLLDSPRIPQRFYSMGGLEICNLDGESDLTIVIPTEKCEKQV